jgi:hypothetical protein
MIYVNIQIFTSLLSLKLKKNTVFINYSKTPFTVYLKGSGFVIGEKPQIEEI